MEQIFSLDGLVAIAMLTLLQAVLGFDNLLYISLESRQAPADKQAMVRRLGIGIAVALRIVLLLAIIKVFEYFQHPWFGIHVKGIIEASFDLQSLIVLIGGVFLVYTATKEILHMMSLEEAGSIERKPRSVAGVLMLIISMNLIFSFDSILAAMALNDNFWIMAIAIVNGGLLMIWLADRVADFLQKNRMYEVLGLFILFVVGIMLLSEGGHLAGISLFGQHVTPMSKGTFYFVIAVLVLTDIVQTRYQRKIQRAKEALILNNS